MDLVLRVPERSEEAEFLRAHRATSPTVPNFLHYYREGMSFVRYPSTFLFAFAGSTIVGRVSIRHSLNPYLERVGGHIGYVVVPEYRRRGCATVILRQSLQIAHHTLGLTRVLVTCDEDNTGSIRAIEKNGGVFESVVIESADETPKRRYWINLADQRGSGSV